ncbi:TadE/TadG family type IV pilus assembly protein [Bosea sp. NPDC055594]
MAAVEFGLIGTLLFMMLAAAVDLSQAFTIQRDITRFTAEAALVLASQTDETLAAVTGQQINAKIANVLPGKTGIEVGSAAITRKNNTILVGVGTMTYLPAEANTSALATLQNEDHGVVVRASYRHEPLILGFAEQFGLRTKTFTAATVALRLREARY